MFVSLSLIARFLAKWTAIVVLVRLLSTAFNWEFGLSRNYLRLLEFVFQFGERRIERAQSRAKLTQQTRPTCPTYPTKGAHENGYSSYNEPDDESDGHDDGENRHNDTQPDDELPAGGRADRLGQRKRKVVVVAGGEHEPHRELLKSTSAHEVDHQQDKQLNKKSRRISRPEGPPIFLLDDLDDDISAGEAQDTTLAGVGCSLDCTHKHEFQMLDAFRLTSRGLSAIIDDQVTKRFTPEELKSWNLLTRTNAKNYQFMSRSLGLTWLLGLLIRYVILLPMRIVYTCAGFLWLTCTMLVIGPLPWRWRLMAYKLISLMAFRMLSCGLTSRLKFHNRQFRARNGDICVANHTSPLDVVVLACDNCYALVGQRHGGLLGILETALSRATTHVWFDRAEMRDRKLVTQRLKEHTSSKDNLPVLIFPEGTCINNSAVMMFRKGSFECTDRVCPVAIKYDSRFGDPFWNSSQQTYVQYLLMMMSSWAIKCEVWYLPPMEREPEESSAEFANRVKAEIARKGGLADLAWDGQLKRSAPKEQWKHQQQEDYASRLKFE